MEKEFIERHSRIKFITRRCPRCGTQCYMNHYQDIICPNCGIVKTSIKSNPAIITGYIG